MSEYDYEITDSALDILKYRNSLGGTDCDNTDESSSGLIAQLGSCCFSDGGCLERIDKLRCEEFGGIYYNNQKCLDLECAITPTPEITPTPTP